MVMNYYGLQQGDEGSFFGKSLHGTILQARETVIFFPIFTQFSLFVLFLLRSSDGTTGCAEILLPRALRSRPCGTQF